MADELIMSSRHVRDPRTPSHAECLVAALHPKAPRPMRPASQTRKLRWPNHKKTHKLPNLLAPDLHRGRISGRKARQSTTPITKCRKPRRSCSKAMAEYGSSASEETGAPRLDTPRARSCTIMKEPSANEISICSISSIASSGVVSLKSSSPLSLPGLPLGCSTCDTAGGTLDGALDSEPDTVGHQPHELDEDVNRGSPSKTLGFAMDHESCFDGSEVGFAGKVQEGEGAPVGEVPMDSITGRCLIKFDGRSAAGTGRNTADCPAISPGRIAVLQRWRSRGVGRLEVR